jgi:bifunctional UDP-N-acetylglucosamine pyrophosphorylase/glucosamine-1-phosphate N-acetyltransferase
LSYYLRMKKTEVIVLAAGKGTRMHSEEPKVLQILGGRTLLDHVLIAARGVNPSKIHVVYGHGGAAVRKSTVGTDINWVQQASQFGTGHAVAQAMPFVEQQSTVLVVYGDVPLIRTETLCQLVEAVKPEQLAILTSLLPDPTGYGRVIRDSQGEVQCIIEETDANEKEKAISEINAGSIAAPAGAFSDWLKQVDDFNAQNECYLTEIVRFLVASGIRAISCGTMDADETRGVNNRIELANAERVFQRRQADRLMVDGLTLRDPDRFDLRGSLLVGLDTVIDINVIIEGSVRLGAEVIIGPNCYIRDSILGDRVVVEANCVIDGARIEPDCKIGPFARLRPETEMATGAKVGNFVETKKARLGAGTKANHLTYLGDADIGKNVNIGAGVITCNYDGADKHKTTIEDEAFIGSDSQLVAPVTVGKGATIGAGSTIRHDAPPGKLTITRAGRAKTLEHWRSPNKTKS